MDIVTYALLKKKITSALSGVKDISLDGERTIKFETNDGATFKINIPTPDLIYVGDEEPPKNSEYELWVDTSDKGTVPLNRAILSEDIVASTIIGSVTAGKTYPVGTNLEDVLRDILTSYSKPTVTLTIEPAKDLYDIVEDTLASIKTNAKVTKGTKNVQSVEFFMNAIEDKKITEGVATGGTFSSIHTFEPPTNKTFTVKATADDGTNRVTVTKTVTFVGKSYFGTVEGKNPEITEDVVKGLQFNTLKNSKNLIYDNIQVYYGKVVYAYPCELGALTKIVDAMGFDYTDSYTMSTMSIDGIDYYCYVLTKAMGTDGLYQKFS